MADNTEPIKDPTWYGHIRGMFTEGDILCMEPKGILLNDYNSVKGHAIGIYGQVNAGKMPPNKPWEPYQVQTFLNWMSNDYPKGNPLPEANLEAAMAAGPSVRERRDVLSLDDTELALLKKAFEGMMAKDASDPESYFTQAALHGLPAPRYCLHHIPSYNPWHRAFLLKFENAMRSIPGCESVTLPYWDIFGDFPELFNQAPFSSYTLPVDVAPGYPKGYTTERFSKEVREQRFKDFNVIGDFERSMRMKDWEDFHGGKAFGGAPDASISAHDGAHVSIGPTMSREPVAAYDPIFWFFHCNIDRMLWEWQKDMRATDLNGLLSTITTADSRNIFTVPPLQILPPFTDEEPKLKTIDIIDSVGQLGVDYGKPNSTKAKRFMEMDRFEAKTIGSVAAAEKFQINSKDVSVRVKDLNRIKIPGSFIVRLQRDGEVIASKAFFQPSEVDKCPTCVKNPLVNFDFKLKLSEVSSGELSVKVEPVEKEHFGDTVPDDLLGNPTVNVRMLLRNE